MGYNFRAQLKNVEKQNTMILLIMIGTWLGISEEQINKDLYIGDK